MGAVTVALVGFFALLMLRVTAPQLTPLFTDLSFEDSAAIVKDLERQGIPYEIRNEGSIVMVPKDRVTRLRMKLAEGGLPKGGGVGYEIFDKSDTLGTTSFVQNINHLRALEGELSRTIRALARVQAARVHLVGVQLTADFDFNRITQTSDRFDPEGRVVRSTQTREESSGAAENQGQVTVGNELPGAQGAQQNTTAREQSKKSEEIVNYDIS